MSILERVTTETKKEPPRLVVYGPPKVGKSTFCSEAPNALTIALEKGTKNIKTAKIDGVENYVEFGMLVNELLNTEHEYKTLVIDNITWLQNLIHKRVCEEDGVTSIEKVQKGFGKGYKVAAEKFMFLLTQLDRLVEEKNMAVVFVGHSTVVDYVDTLGQDYKRQMIECHKDIAGLLEKWSDGILFATKRVFTRTEDKGFGNSQTKAAGGDERILICDNAPGALACNRYGLPSEIPLKWQELVNNMYKES